MTILKLVPSAASADEVLDRAKAAGLEHVVVIGWDKNELCYFESSYEDGPPILWLLEIARSALMDMSKEET